jgi:hypothetical protein
MKTMTRLLIIVSIITLTACATTYHGRSSSGGYASEKVMGGYLRVEFDGNSSTSKADVLRFAMRRIAEIGRNKHQKYVALYHSLSDTAIDVKSDAPVFAEVYVFPIAYAYVKYSNQKQPGDLSVETIYKNSFKSSR